MFAQRRNYDLEYTQPIVKFFAQMRSEFLTGRGKYPSVHWDFVLAAKPPHSQVLENAQQLWLRGLAASRRSRRETTCPREPAQSNRPSAPWLP